MVGDIQKLRDLTGAGVMECKRALEEAKNDFDQAVRLIHEKGLAKAAKKSERATGAGVLISYVHNERIGVLLELRCETDFVARAPEFKDFAKEIAMQIAALDPADEAALLAQPYIKDQGQTVEEVLKQAVAKFGENIKVARFCRYELG